jgi:hypothetical protein
MGNERDHRFYLFYVNTYFRLWNFVVNKQQKSIQIQQHQSTIFINQLGYMKLGTAVMVRFDRH